MGKDLEKDFNDEVYEDEYYEEHFEEEELIGEDEVVDTVAADDDEEDELEEGVQLEEGEEWEDKKNTRKVEVSYACEDCDYRWDDVIFKKKNRLEDDEELEVVCPMCGSTTITQI
ncbi:MAG: hypothetical protein EHM32_08730 [Spirochaetales bacterium]|nr:MAG: hypothetical protein EHM32_08730 [Spirochaetales bacterium]